MMLAHAIWNLSQGPVSRLAPEVNPGAAAIAGVGGPAWDRRRRTGPA